MKPRRDAPQGARVARVRVRWGPFGCLTAPLLAAIPIAVVCGNCGLHAAEVSNADVVVDAIARAAVHPTVVEVLGTPQTVHTWVARDMDLSWSAGGTSLATPFPRPGATRKRVGLLTTIDGPKGSAYLDVSGTQDLTDGAWRDVRMLVSGTDLGDVASFSVDLTRPDDPGTVVRR